MLRFAPALALVLAAVHARAEEPIPAPPAPPAPAPIVAPTTPPPPDAPPGVEVRTEGRPQPKDLGPPQLVLGPNVSARFPYAWIAGGAFLSAYIPGALTLHGQAQYGLARTTRPDGDWGQFFWELYAGYPLGEWTGTNNINYVIEQKNEGDVLVATFTKVDVVTHHLITVETGVQSGTESFTRLIEAVDTKTQKTSAFALPFERRLTTFAAGARYRRAWNSEMGRGYTTSRNYDAFYVHALLAGLGAPDGAFHVGRTPGSTRAAPTRVGVEVGGTWNFWANSPAPLDFAAGWLPGGLGVYVSVGLSLPVWVL